MDVSCSALEEDAWDLEVWLLDRADGEVVRVEWERERERSVTEEDGEERGGVVPYTGMVLPVGIGGGS